MARAVWYLERYEKAATKANWSGEFPDFMQVLELVTTALASGKAEKIRFIAPDKAPPDQINQLLALGASEKTSPK